MTQDEIIRMFHEAGELAGWKPGVGNPLVINYLTHFAALVAAHEREKHERYKEAYEVWQDKTEWVQESAQPNELGMHRADVLKQRIEAAVLAEREACAKLLLDDALALTFQTFGQYRTALAAAIRARSTNSCQNSTKLVSFGE